MSELVRKKFDLRHMVAVECGSANEAHIRRVLAQTAGGLLSEIVTESDVLGIGYGRTLTIMAETMNELAHCPVLG